MRCWKRPQEPVQGGPRAPRWPHQHHRHLRRRYSRHQAQQGGLPQTRPAHRHHYRPRHHRRAPRCHQPRPRPHRPRPRRPRARPSSRPACRHPISVSPLRAHGTALVLRRATVAPMSLLLSTKQVVTPAVTMLVYFWASAAGTMFKTCVRLARLPRCLRATHCSRKPRVPVPITLRRQHRHQRCPQRQRRPRRRRRHRRPARLAAPVPVQR